MLTNQKWIQFSRNLQLATKKRVCYQTNNLALLIKKTRNLNDRFHIQEFVLYSSKLIMLTNLKWYPEIYFCIKMLSKKPITT